MRSELPDLSHLDDAERLLQAVKFEVRAVDITQRDGSTRRREVVVHPGAVIILPVFDDGTIAMIRNERFAVGETLWELPAGTLEAPEPPIECAKRELIEEAGYEAGTIEPLSDFYTCPGICTERMYAFVASDLKHVGQQLEPSEKITVEIVPMKRAVKLIEAGEIRDGKTIATLLHYHTFGSRGTR